MPLAGEGRGEGERAGKTTLVKAAIAAIPERCALIAMRAMAKQPAERYQSAERMLEALEKVLSGTAEVVTEKTPDWNDFLAAADRLRGAHLAGGALASRGREPNVTKSPPWRRRDK